MSIEAEDETGQEQVDNDEQIIKLLKAQVYLLEIIANKDIGTTLPIFEE